MHILVLIRYKWTRLFLFVYVFNTIICSLEPFTGHRNKYLFPGREFSNKCTWNRENFKYKFLLKATTWFYSTLTSKSGSRRHCHYGDLILCSSPRKICCKTINHKSSPNLANELGGIWRWVAFTFRLFYFINYLGWTPLFASCWIHFLSLFKNTEINLLAQFLKDFIKTTTEQSKIITIMTDKRKILVLLRKRKQTTVTPQKTLINKSFLGVCS